MPPKKGDKAPHKKHPAKHVAAKKHSAHKPHPKKQAHNKDLRRAFEHMGRVLSLHSSLTPASRKPADVLVKLAHQELTTGSEQNAADLLRAAEHLGFAVLAADSTSSLSPALIKAIQEQYERLEDKATEHWEEQSAHPEELAKIYEAARKAAAKAFKDEQYHRALEYQRAAESLAHVELEPARKLNAGKSQRQLKTS